VAFAPTAACHADKGMPPVPHTILTIGLPPLSILILPPRIHPRIWLPPAQLEVIVRQAAVLTTGCCKLVPAGFADLSFT